MAAAGTTTFRDILREKMASSTPLDEEICLESPSVRPVFELLHGLNVQRFYPSPASKYPHPKPRPAPSRSKPEKVYRTVAIAELTPQERKALAVLFDPHGATESTVLNERCVKRQFRKLARELHPDCHRGASEDQIRQLSTEFTHVRQAYALITMAFGRARV